MLPLDNYSGDPSQDYFAEGMTDELTAHLANISQLRVISRGSAMQFKGAHRPPTPEIARTLDVDAVVEGSVLRAGDKVRITAQLIDARADRHLWAKSFERNSRDVLALQDELASAIAREIHVQLTPAEQSRLASAPSVNPEAYDAYLKGRYFFNRPSDENLQQGDRALRRGDRAGSELRPRVLGALGRLPLGRLQRGSPDRLGGEAQGEGRRREGHRSSTTTPPRPTPRWPMFKLWYEYDWAGSEAEFRRAFALNPNYAFAHDQFGLGLAFQGRLDEAIAEGKRAAELDPLSPQIPLDAIFAFGLARASTRRRRSWPGGPRISIRPTSFLRCMDGWIDIQAGKVQDAIPQFQKAKAMGVAGVRLRLARLRIRGFRRSSPRAGGARGPEEDVAARLRHAVQPGARVSRPGRSRARPDYLEQAYASDSQWLGWLKGDRIFDPLRSEPRFAALMESWASRSEGGVLPAVRVRCGVLYPLPPWAQLVIILTW